MIHFDDVTLSTMADEILKLGIHIKVDNLRIRQLSKLLNLN